MIYVHCNLHSVIKQPLPPPLLAPPSTASRAVRLQLLSGLQASPVWTCPSYHVRDNNVNEKLRLWDRMGSCLGLKIESILYLGPSWAPFNVFLA